MVNLTSLLAEAMTGNWIGDLLYAMYNAIGNFGWTVVVFTICLKVLVSPFDIWQKMATRKNNKAMRIMQPELDRIKSSYEGNPQMLNQKQRELYKKHGYSTLGACLPSLITLVIFFVVFSGFNACVKYENKRIVNELAIEYQAKVLDAENADDMLISEAEQIMIDKYNTLSLNEKGKDRWKFIWVENVFMPDTWADPIPSLDTYVNNGLGKLGIPLDIDLNARGYDSPYDAVLGPMMELKNKQGETGWKKFWDVEHWNGYLILPVLSLVLSIISSKLLQGNQPTPTQTDKDGKGPNPEASAKMMTYLMPLMMGIFSLFYSAAFTIYMFTNSLITVLINVIFNLCAKRKDEAEEQKIKDAPYRRGL